MTNIPANSPLQMPSLLPPWPENPGWELASPEVHEKSIQYGSTFILKKLSDGRLMIDAKHVEDGSILIRAWKREDSSHYATLKAQYPHLPRQVLAPYRAENILAIWRATEAWPIIKMMDDQYKAWAKYAE